MPAEQTERTANPLPPPRIRRPSSPVYSQPRTRGGTGPTGPFCPTARLWGTGARRETGIGRPIGRTSLSCGLFLILGCAISRWMKVAEVVDQTLPRDRPAGGLRAATRLSVPWVGLFWNRLLPAALGRTRNRPGPEVELPVQVGGSLSSAP